MRACRITGVAKGTVTKLLVDLGEACSAYMAETLVDLPCERIQVDEIWAFCDAEARTSLPRSATIPSGAGWIPASRWFGARARIWQRSSPSTPRTTRLAETSLRLAWTAAGDRRAVEAAAVLLRPWALGSSL